MKTQKHIYFVSILLILITILLFSISIRYYKPKKFLKSSLSMEPTLNRSAFCERRLFPFSKLKRGDIVLYSRDDAISPNERFLSRVIGLPGEKISIKDNEVVIDGNVLTEEYLQRDTQTQVLSNTEWIIDEGEYFIMGDNRDFSSDSRVIGPIKKTDVQSIISEC